MLVQFDKIAYSVAMDDRFRDFVVSMGPVEVQGKPYSAYQGSLK